MNHRLQSLAVLFSLAGLSLALAQPTKDDALRAKAEKLAHEYIIVDTHIDVPEHLRDNWQDISQRTPDGEFDYPRARQGGLEAPFMSIYIPAEEEKAGTAKKSADMLIDMVYKFVTLWPDKFALATSPDEVRTDFKAGKMALCMGLENGAPIYDESDVEHFHRRGIRYVTLTHFLDNHICDTSHDTTHTWHGLSPFGKKLIPELNKAGIMVDVSHISDETFYQVIKISKAPVIASHSSCRYFTPGFERNMADDMIKLLAANGGVIQISIGSDFLSRRYREQQETARKEITDYLRSHNLRNGDSTAVVYIRQYRKDHPIAHASVRDAVAHIEHVVKLVGIDHVGIGSDFDGVGDTLPVGLEDVSKYPNLIYELLKDGFSDEDIRKVCGENLLRVWAQVEKTAKDFQQER